MNAVAKPRTAPPTLKDPTLLQALASAPKPAGETPAE